MSIPQLRQNPAGKWYAFWSDGKRSKRKSMGTTDKAVAKARFAQWLLIDGAEQNAAPEAAYTVRDLWTVYAEKHLPTVASPDTAMHSWKALSAHFGDLLVPEVSGAVEGYIARRLKVVKPSTIRRELVALRACLNWCASPQRGRPMIEKAPGFRVPPDGPPRDRWLTTAEIDKIFAAANGMPRAKLFLHIALETAARKQAILDLTWDRVDFETKVIHLHDPSRPVTKKRRASVPISAALLPVLQAAYEARDNALVMGSKAEVYHAVQRVAERAGVAGVTPHVLRHTAATHMARRGVPLWIIAKVLGNSLAMVEKVYAKHAPDDLRAAVDLITGGK